MDIKDTKIGFGTWQLQGKVCDEVVAFALQTGYTHIDTADIYQNHRDVAQGIKNSGVARDKFFLTSKIWRTNLDPQPLKADAQRFLEELETDYLDLLLVHWPNSTTPIGQTLGAMQELKEQGLIRNFGISNFTIELIAEIPESFELSNHQFEYHPSLQQKDLLQASWDRGMSVSAYSPLAQGHDLQLSQIQEIAEKHEVSSAQVVLAWLRQRKLIPIVRSSNHAHIENNFASLQLQLSEAELSSIDELDSGKRFVNPGFSPF